MKKAISFAAVLVAVMLAIQVVAAAGGWWRYGSADRQAVRSGGGNSTQTTTWGWLAGFGPSDGLIVDTRGAMSVTLSVELTGAPAQFRVESAPGPVFGNATIMSPGAVQFDPGGGTDSFSFTFGRALAPGRYEITLAWRSPTGAEVHIDRLSLDAIYGSR